MPHVTGQELGLAPHWDQRSKQNGSQLRAARQGRSLAYYALRALSLPTIKPSTAAVNFSLGPYQSTSTRDSTVAECLYTIQDIAGKCRGVLAASFISKGTRIICEPPLFRVRRGGNSKEQLHKTILKTIAGLVEEQRQQFLALHNAFDDELGPDLGRIRTNTLPLGSNATEGGIFLDSSRINHSCVQNAQNTWNEDLRKLVIHALRDILQGEEITIFYLPDRPNHQTRYEALLSSFRFTCSCRLCSLPPEERQKIDENLDEIRRFDQSIGDEMMTTSAPLRALHYVRRLLALLDNEGIADASVARAYHDDFQIAVIHGDLARASIFAKRAASTRAMMEGKDSPTVHKMERDPNNPSEHSICGYAVKWRTAMDDAPTGLNGDAYERWLWKEEQASDGRYANLRNEVPFPSFESLPRDSDIDMEYLGTTDGSRYSPIKHWCFLGEIVDVEAFLRLRLIVRDKANHRVTIAFHTDERGEEVDQASLKRGYTVAILFVEHHGFMDMSEGIRHKVPSHIKIFPVSLNDLLSLSDKIQQYSTNQNGFRSCQGCDQRATSLQKRARCDLFWYCNKSCQVTGWNEKSHKAHCKHLKDPV